METWKELTEKYNYDPPYDSSNSISLLIAGPINMVSLNNIENYRKFFSPIIISAWSDFPPDAPLILQSFLSKDSGIGLKVFMNKSPGKSSIIKNKMFRQYKTLLPQVCGILNGVMECNTKYLVKTRSDEIFTDLSPMIDLFYKNPKKVIWGSVKDQRGGHLGCLWDRMPDGRIGDHLFIAETDLIKRTYTEFLNLASRSPHPEGGLSGERKCEETLSKLFVKNQSHENQNNLFLSINMEKMGKFIISVNGSVYS